MFLCLDAGEVDEELQNENETEDAEVECGTPEDVSSKAGEISSLQAASNIEGSLPRLSTEVVERHVCDFCDFRHPSELRVKKHAALKHPVYLICDTCGKRFRSKVKIIAHMKKAHLPSLIVQNIECITCKEKFSCKKYFEDHLTPNPKGIDFCSICKKAFQNFDELKNHCLAVHNKDCTSTLEDAAQNIKVVLACKCCNKEFDNYILFGMHRTKHKPVCDGKIKKLKKIYPLKRQIRQKPLQSQQRKLPTLLPKISEKCENLTPAETLREFFSKYPNIDTNNDSSKISGTPQSKNAAQGKKNRSQNKSLIKTKQKSVRKNGVMLIDNNAQEHISTEYNAGEESDKKKVYQCGLCSVREDSKDKLMEHFKSHSKFQVQCKECSVFLYSAVDFKKHQNYHWKPGMSLSCKSCDTNFTEKSQIVEHMRKIHDYKYDCPFCGEQFSSKVKATAHEKNHPEHSRFVCTYCERKFRTLDALNKHLDHKHTTQNCVYCDKEFENSIALNKHECPLNESRKKYQCTYCSKEFKSRSGYHEHELSHTGNHKYYCSDCNKKFNNKRVYNEHLNAKHSENPKSLYSCETCGQQFLHLGSLINHKRLKHTKVFSYICEYCGQVINTEGFVKIHLRKHTGELPYKCSYCPKSYSNGSYLRRHLMKHTKQYAYNCDDCNKGFSDRKPFFQHRLKIHGDNSSNESCQVCKDLNCNGKQTLYALHRFRVHGEPLASKVVPAKISTDFAVKSEENEEQTVSALDLMASETFIDELESAVSQTIEVVVQQEKEVGLKLTTKTKKITPSKKGRR